MAGSARGHRQLAIAASDTSEGGVKGSEGGGTICNRSPTGPRTADPSAGSDGACMMEYVLCKIYRSRRAQLKPSSAAPKTAKRKANMHDFVD